MIGIAFIGSGSIVEERHAPEAFENKGINIIGYYNRTPEKARILSKKYGGIVYNSIDKLLEDVNVDAVVVSSINKLHSEHTIQALDKGKHVLCEKPMALTLDEANEMIQSSKKANRILMIAHNLRLEPAFVAAKAVLQSGKLGKVISFTSVIGGEGPECERNLPTDNLWFYHKNLAGIGVLGDLGIHSVETLNYLLEDEFEEVSCLSVTSDKKFSNGEFITVEDNSTCILKTKSNIIGTMSASWSYYDGWTSAMVLYCQNGVIRINSNPEFPLILNMKDGTVYKEDISDYCNNQDGSGIMKMFVNSIETNSEPVLNGEAGFSALKVILASVESSRAGQSVKIRLFDII